MIITSNQWLAKSPEGYEEMAAFGRKFAEKLGMTFDGKGNWQQTMSQTMPQLAAGMEKLAEEGKKLEGFPVRTESVFETEGQPAPEGGQMESGQTEEGEQTPPTSVGGLLGGLGKKMAKKPKAENSSGRNVMFESTSETTEYKTTSIPAETFQVPAGYKMEKVKVE